MREFLLFYSSFYESAQYLADDERLKFYEAVIEYGLLEKEPELYGTTMGMFMAVKPVIDAGIKRRKNAEINGKKGGRPRKAEETVKVSAEPKKAVSKPKIDEISEYVKEKQYHVDAEQFYNFYESKGWKIGKAPMKNWRSAVATWEKRYLDEHPMQKPKPKQVEQKAEYSDEERKALLEQLNS